MRTLDQTKPYAEVHGLPGAMYEQNGILFRGNGEESVSTEHILEEVAPKESDDPLPYICCVEQKSESSDPIEIELSTGRDLETMHWRHLKSLVEIYGGIWENKEKAMAFLNGKA